MQGEIMKRLQVAKQYNVKENKTLLAQGRRKVPLVQIRLDKGVQTGFLPAATLSRFQQLIQGPPAAILYRIWDIPNGGYGYIDTTNLYFLIDNSKTLWSLHSLKYTAVPIQSSNHSFHVKSAIAW